MPEIGKVFIYNTTVFLGDTNAEGNVYWLNYYRWFGQAREQFLYSEVPNINELMENGLRLITVETSIKHLQSLFLFDQVRIEIVMSDVTRMSLRMQALFLNGKTANVVARGWQRIACTDASGGLSQLPQEIRGRALDFFTPTPGHVVE